MSRCSICDFSSSSSSIYHEGIVTHHKENNRVVYVPKADKDICLACIEDYQYQLNYWLDKEIEDDVLPTIEEEDEYTGCTDIDCS